VVSRLILASSNDISPSTGIELSVFAQDGNVNPAGIDAIGAALILFGQVTVIVNSTMTGDGFGCGEELAAAGCAAFAACACNMS